MKKLSGMLMGADAVKTVVFSGGTSNLIDGTGTLVRNTARDGLNEWLDEEGIPFYDPQIHPQSHGRDYDYDVDGPAEKAARDAAKVTVYEVGPFTSVVVTCDEVRDDVRKGKNVVLWLTGETFDKNGNPLFTPTFDVSAAPAPFGAHLKEYVKMGNRARKEMLTAVKGQSNVRVVRTLDEAKEAIQEFMNS